MDATANIEDQLRAAIRNSDVTRYRLAKLSGVSEGQLSRFVMDKGDPRHRTLTLPSAARIAEVLGLELRPMKRQKGKAGRWQA